MKNTNAELVRALALMDRARDLQEQAHDATLDCLNYLESRTDKNLRHYGTDLNYHRTLLEAIEDYIKGDEYVLENSTILEYDIKDAMGVKDYD
jgi:hypothetical protein